MTRLPHVRPVLTMYGQFGGVNGLRPEKTRKNHCAGIMLYWLWIMTMPETKGKPENRHHDCGNSRNIRSTICQIPRRNTKEKDLDDLVKETGKSDLLTEIIKGY